MKKNTLAIRYYEMADSSAGGKVALYRSNITREWRDLKKYDNAMRSALIGLTNFPSNEKILYDMGNSLNHKERYSEAMIYARKLLKKNPRTADDWFDIAHIFDCSGNSDSAMLYYKVSLKLNPEMAKANLNIGILYYMIWGKFDKAHEHYDRALRIDPTYELAINAKRNAYTWQHDFVNSYKWSEKYMEYYPDGEYAFLGIGYSLMELRKYKEAIPWFEKKLIQVPNDDRALNNLGRCYARLGDTTRAFDYFRKALAINPENSYIYHNRASLYNDLARYDLACSDLQKSIEKQYTWLIDSSLVLMKNKYCPQINLNRKVLINSYRGNEKKLSNRSFIELIDSQVDKIQINESSANSFEVKIPNEKPELSSPQNAFNFYPNPSTGVFTVERLAWEKENLTLRVFDLQGKLVKTQDLTDEKTILDLGSLTNGTYVAMVLNSTSVLATKKLVVTEH